MAQPVKRVVGVTVLLLTVAAGLHCWYYVATILPLPPEEEVYANTVGFQVMAWALVRLPFWILLCIVFTSFEVILLRRNARG